MEVVKDIFEECFSEGIMEQTVEIAVPRERVQQRTAEVLRPHILKRLSRWYLDNVDLISSNVNSSRQEAMLYVFEDNEAVIKMIIKGRSPTMRCFQNPQSFS